MEIVPDREGEAEPMMTPSPKRNSDTSQRGDRMRGLVPLVMVVAIVIAPLLASLVRLEAGLLVMGVALSVTAMLLRGSLGELPAQHRRMLGLLFIANVGLAVACFAAAIVRLIVG